MSNHFEAEKEEGATLRKNRCPDMLASFESSGMSFRLHGVKEPPKSPRESQINYISIGIKRKPKDGELARLKQAAIGRASLTKRSRKDSRERDDDQIIPSKDDRSSMNNQIQRLREMLLKSQTSNHKLIYESEENVNKFNSYMQEMENKLEIKEGKISELQHVLDVRENACKEHMQLLQHTREENQRLNGQIESNRVELSQLRNKLIKGEDMIQLHKSFQEGQNMKDRVRERGLLERAENLERELSREKSTADQLRRELDRKKLQGNFQADKFLELTDKLQKEQRRCLTLDNKVSNLQSQLRVKSQELKRIQQNSHRHSKSSRNMQKQQSAETIHSSANLQTSLLEGSCLKSQIQKQASFLKQKILLLQKSQNELMNYIIQQQVGNNAKKGLQTVLNQGKGAVKAEPSNPNPLEEKIKVLLVDKDSRIVQLETENRNLQREAHELRASCNNYRYELELKGQYSQRERSVRGLNDLCRNSHRTERSWNDYQVKSGEKDEIDEVGLQSMLREVNRNSQTMADYADKIDEIKVKQTGMWTSCMFDGKNVAKTARTVPKAVLDTIQKQQETLKILEGKMDQLLNKGEKDSRHGKQQKKAKQTQSKKNEFESDYYHGFEADASEHLQTSQEEEQDEQKNICKFRKTKHVEQRRRLLQTMTNTRQYDQGYKQNSPCKPMARVSFKNDFKETTMSAANKHPGRLRMIH